jgi:hypothetical protein
LWDSSCKLITWRFYYDKIIRANEGWGSCWSVVVTDYKTLLDGKDMQATLDSFSVTFKE